MVLSAHRFVKTMVYGNGDAMKKKLSLMLITLLLAGMMLSACSKSDPAVGFWIVQKVTAGDVVMNEEDAESIGLTAVGTIKLQKSGSCELNLLGEEAEGTWEKAKDGTITVKYGEDQMLTGSIDDEGIMTLTDPQGAEYTLAK